MKKNKTTRNPALERKQMFFHYEEIHFKCAKLKKILSDEILNMFDWYHPKSIAAMTKIGIEDAAFKSVFYGARELK